MRIVFMGTPDFAVPTLKRLSAEGHDIRLVISQPDRPAGRGLKVRPTPVKVAAMELGIEVFQPEKINTPEARELISSREPEAIVVAAYGRILGKKILDMPPLGCVNLHSSLLPQLRGAAPIQRAVMYGLDTTGVTTMLMNEKMDEGDILLGESRPIRKEETAGELHDALAEMGAGLMARTMELLGKGGILPVGQDHSLATYAPRIEPEEREIDWTEPATVVDGRIRGLSPFPGAYTYFRGKRVLILRSRMLGEQADSPGAAPGAITGIKANHLEVQTGRGTLAILEIRPEGKKAMTSVDWARGARLGGSEYFDTTLGG